MAQATAGAAVPHHQICITKGMRVWLEFLSSYNGVSVWQQPLELKGGMEIHLDAVGASGFGVYFNGHWCSSKWPECWAGMGLERDLRFLELVPILVAMAIWEPEFRNRWVVFWCNNQVVVRVVIKQTEHMMTEHMMTEIGSVSIQELSQSLVHCFLHSF